MTDNGSVRDRLATALVSGDLLDLLTEPDMPDAPVLAESVMHCWKSDHDHELSAADLFEFLRRRGLGDGAVAHPQGVRLRGARIVGRLVLDFVVDALPLQLIDCLLDDGVSAYSVAIQQGAAAGGSQAPVVNSWVRTS